jgi:hypothetical protein
MNGITDERLAEALAIERWKGADAHVYIAARIGALALAGDAAGVERFKAIAAKLDCLRRGASADV